MTPKERRAYDEHMDNIMVQNDVLDTAHEEGYIQGLADSFSQRRAEGKYETLCAAVMNMRKKGLDDAAIADLLNVDLSMLNL